MYVRMYVCIYVCMYVCMYDYMYKELRSLRSLQLLRVWLSLASLAQSQGVMSWLGSVTPSVASARFARSLTWA